MAIYEIQGQHGACTLDISGRDEWALRHLMAAGAKGCTPIDNPAPRWSAYVHKLRRMGIDIETIDERHGGPFPGRHARYVLHSAVRALEAQHGEAA
jgi:Winged helix domain